MIKLKKNSSNKLQKVVKKRLNHSHSAQFLKSKSLLKQKHPKLSISTHQSLSKIINNSNQKIQPKNKTNSKTKNKSKNKHKKLVLKQQKILTVESDKKSKIIEDYFIYNNVFIPIENSQQRRFVHKIKLVQTNIIKRPNDDFLKQQKKIHNKQIMTQKNILITSQNQTQNYNTQNIQIQTQLLQNPYLRKNYNHNHLCIEEVGKCFNDTLAQLEFLYLPESKNFDNFTQNQCRHYNELFLTLANKFATKINQKPFHKNENENQICDQSIILLLYQRQCQQMGWVQTSNNKGFPTHLFSIISYITNLFCYSQLKQRSNVLNKMSTISNCTYPQRFNRLTRGTSNQKKTTILSQELFSTLESYIFAKHQFSSQLIQQLVHIHNKAIFDAVNELLEQYRPFYAIRGQPFPWNSSLGMTFFSIDESSLHLLFSQIKEKIIDNASLLCGIHIQYNQNATQKEEKNGIQNITQKHHLHLQRINQQQNQLIKQFIQKSDQRGDLEQEYTRVMVKLSHQIFIELINQWQQQNDQT